MVPSATGDTNKQDPVKKKKKKSNKTKKPKLLVPPLTNSRKQARKVTTLFHRYSKQKDVAAAAQDTKTVQQLEEQLHLLGGRVAYQRASQVSTSFFSTSRWVLGILSRNGWLYGRRRRVNAVQACTKPPDSSSTTKHTKKAPRHRTRVLEIGAINTELIDAAVETILDKTNGMAKPKYNLQVRAIDINSMHPAIEEVDFLSMPLLSDSYNNNNNNINSNRDRREQQQQLPNPLPDHDRHVDDTDASTQQQQLQYDVIVCSMVLNCVTQPEERGHMLLRIHHFLSDDSGLCFFTIPKTCLTVSPYTDHTRFRSLVQDIGFDILDEHCKETPKVSFFVLQKKSHPLSPETLYQKWEYSPVIHRGTKYRTDFSITLSRHHVKQLVN